MPQSEIRKSFAFDRLGNYRICVQGSFEETAARLGGMRVTVSSRGDQGLITALAGRVRDQAEPLSLTPAMRDRQGPVNRLL